MKNTQWSDVKITNLESYSIDPSRPVEQWSATVVFRDEKKRSKRNTVFAYRSLRTKRKCLFFFPFHRVDSKNTRKEFSQMVFQRMSVRVETSAVQIDRNVHKALPRETAYGQDNTTSWRSPGKKIPPLPRPRRHIARAHGAFNERKNHRPLKTDVSGYNTLRGINKIVALSGRLGKRRYLSTRARGPDDKTPDTRRRQPCDNRRETRTGRWS